MTRTNLPRRSSKEVQRRHLTPKRRWAFENLERRMMLTATAIAGGETIAGNIATKGQQDTYTLTASANDWFDLTVSDAGSNTGARPEISVYGPTGTLVAQAMAPGRAASTSVYYAVPQTGGGNYSVVVQDEAVGLSQTGAYSLRVTGDLLLTLANLSDNVYSGAIGAGGFTPIGGQSTDPKNPGYAAAAFLSPDKSQVVIAIRGTVTTPGLAQLEDLDADVSFFTSVATPGLNAILSDAAHFVATIHSEYQGATITLTGHSLGASVAQLLGQESRLSVETFNGAGGAALFSQVSTALAPVDHLGSSGSSIQYRLYGDQFSLAGTQFANTQTITAADPAGTTFFRFSDKLVDLVANASTFFEVHRIVTVIQQIEANAPLMPSDAHEPNDVAAIEEILAALGFATNAMPANNAGLLVGHNVDLVFGML